MRAPISFHNELPIRVHRYKLDPVKAKEFNHGYKTPAGKRVRFARSNYKYLWELDIDKGEGKTYIKLATPDFMQLLYSIKVLWNAYPGKPYDRHGHPVVMQAFDVEDVPMEATTKDDKTRKKLVQNFQKTYAKNKS